jgi:hypothetical protein
VQRYTPSDSSFKHKFASKKAEKVLPKYGSKYQGRGSRIHFSRWQSSSSWGCVSIGAHAVIAE